METIKQKFEGESTKDTEVEPVQIVTDEEYIELFGTRSDDETFLSRFELDWVGECRGDTRGTV